ncbi:MAG: hypothetical protein ACI87J_002680 [Colwellia sp.]|jgi:uncharacterized protein YnzC (UPF0291/DUF896 family)
MDKEEIDRLNEISDKAIDNVLTSMEFEEFTLLLAIWYEYNLHSHT